jgi:hypothetical protein
MKHRENGWNCLLPDTVLSVCLPVQVTDRQATNDRCYGDLVRTEHYALAEGVRVQSVSDQYREFQYRSQFASI